MFSLISELNVIGIICEIIGFIIIIFAVQPMKPGKGSFSSVWDQARNIMSTLYPKWNYSGIALVILGLALQLVNALYT